MASRGSLIDLIYIAVIIFVIAISVLFGSFLMGKISPALQNNTNVQELNSTILQQGESMYDTTWDSMFLFLIIAAAAITAIGAFYIKTHPAFFIIGIIIFSVVLLLSLIFGNIYGSIADTDDMADTANRMDIMGTVMNNFGIIMLIVIVLVVVALFARGYMGGGEGGY